MLLLKNARVFAPEALGMKDVLVGGGKILCMEDKIEVSLPGLETVDCEGLRLIPGIIDQHVHIIGGGGEGGLSTRTPELKFSDAVEAGCTTLVGLLGTDSITKDIKSLVAKAKALKEEGLSCFCLSGAYQYPSPTLTGSVMTDMVYVEEIIGCKLALAEHRGSHPTEEELIRLVSDLRMASLVSHKPGVLHIHMGRDASGIQPVFDILDRTDLPAWHFRPTHMAGHVEQGIELNRRGGYVDISANRRAPKAVLQMLDAGADPKLITMSSDGNGSLPKWDEAHLNIVGMDVGRMKSLFDSFAVLVQEKGLPFETVLPMITSQVADALMFEQKGRIQTGKDADLVLIDEDFKIQSVFAKEKALMREGEILVKGSFED